MEWRAILHSRRVQQSVRCVTAKPFGKRKRGTMKAKAEFPHRHNGDGTYDSICTVCLATVATSQNEAELRVQEEAHVCDLLWVSRRSKEGVLQGGPITRFRTA